MCDDEWEKSRRGKEDMERRVCREKRTGDMILMAVHGDGFDGDGFDGVGKSNRSPHHQEVWCGDLRECIL